MLTKNSNVTAAVIASGKLSGQSRAELNVPVVDLFIPNNNCTNQLCNNSKSNKSDYQLSLMTGPAINISINNCDGADFDNTGKQITICRPLNDRKASFALQTTCHKNRAKVKRVSGTLQNRCRNKNSRGKIKSNKSLIERIQNGKSDNRNKIQENIPTKTIKQSRPVDSQHNANSRPNKNSGFITCLVCNQTKFYSHVQRRYGIFSCEPCFKFFAKFIKEPKQFICENKGKCLIIVFDHDNPIGDERPNKLDASNGTGSKCKACWLKHCLDKFKINSDTKQLLIAKYYPQTETNDQTVPATRDGERSKPAVVDSKNAKHSSLKCPNNKIVKLKNCQTIDGQSKRSGNKSSKAKPNISKCDKKSKLQISPMPLKLSSSSEMADNVDKKHSPVSVNDKSDNPTHDQIKNQSTSNENGKTTCKNRKLAHKSKPLQLNELVNNLQPQQELSPNRQHPAEAVNNSSTSTCTTQSPKTNPPKPNSPSIQVSQGNGHYSTPISSLSLQTSSSSSPLQNVDKTTLYSNTLPDFNNSFFPKLVPQNLYEKPQNVSPLISTNNLHYNEKFANGYSSHELGQLKYAGYSSLSDDKSNSNKLQYNNSSEMKSISNASQYEGKIDSINLPKSISTTATKNGNNKRSISKEQNRFCNGKKSRCKDCEGCRAQDCGQCTYCLDKKKFGGQNVIKQACKFRVCIRFKNSQKLKQQNSGNSLAACVLGVSNPSDKTSASASSGNSNPPSIQSSQSFYPTPPPHSNSHGSPNSLVSSNLPNHSGHCHKTASLSTTSNDPNSPTIFNLSNSQAHLSSLPTPTSSPLSQVGSVTNYRPAADLGTIVDYNPDYDNCYGNTPFTEQDPAGNGFVTNSITSNGYNYASNLNRQEPACQAATLNAEPATYSYPTPISDLNFNCKINPCSNKLDQLQGQLITGGQYCSNTSDYIAGHGSYSYPNDYLTTQPQNTKTNWNSQHSSQFSNINQAPETFNNSYNFYNNHNSPFPFHSYNYEPNYYY